MYDVDIPENRDLKHLEAQRLVRTRFRSARQLEHCIKSMEFCEENCMGQNKVYRSEFVRKQREMLSLAIVDIVIGALPAEQRQYVIMKYKEHRQADYIQYQLKIGPRIQTRWNREFIDELVCAEDYRLYPIDVFRPNKVLNMIYILDMRINKFLECYDMPCNKAWLSKLMRYRFSHRQLYGLMRAIIAHLKSCDDREQVFYQIINAKFANPYVQNQQLAERFYVSDGTVSKYLTKYRNRTQRYLSSI